MPNSRIPQAHFTDPDLALGAVTSQGRAKKPRAGLLALADHIQESHPGNPITEILPYIFTHPKAQVYKASRINSGDDIVLKGGITYQVRRHGPGIQHTVYGIPHDSEERGLQHMVHLQVGPHTLAVVAPVDNRKILNHVVTAMSSPDLLHERLERAQQMADHIDLPHE